MAKKSMDDLLKRRMSAAQQASELEVGNEAYETMFQAKADAAVPRFCELPINSLCPFRTADIGFHPYPPEKLRAFSQQLAEQGIYERIIVRPVPNSEQYEILAGHNRTRAWRLTGHQTIPAEVVEADDARAISIAVATNLLRRQDLTIIERGKAYRALLIESNRNGQRNVAYRGLHYPVHLLSCDETGARQLQIMAVPDYRMKLAKLMLRSAYRPPPEDAPAWDAIYQNRPFVIGADMNLRRIDAAIASAKKRGCLPISLAALDAQGDAVLLRRYKDTGYAVIYKVTESVLTELFGRPPSLYLPPCTQYLTKKGAVVDAPLIQVDRKDRGSPRK